MSRRYGLGDEQWLKIEGMLPGRKGSVGRPARDNRLFIEGVLYRYRSGIPWRDLPEGMEIFEWSINVLVYGQRRACGRRYLRYWEKNGIMNMR